MHRLRRVRLFIEAYPHYYSLQIYIQAYIYTQIRILFSFSLSIARTHPMLERLSPKESDPLTQNWFLCSSAWPVVIITIGYLLSVPLGKRWMSARVKPFDVRLPMVLYNVLAILVNAYVVLLAVRTITLKSYRIYCQGVMHGPEDIHLARAVWWYFISKAFEFWDTWFFILTKKFSHVSILHVYHHATMFPIWYLAT